MAEKQELTITPDLQTRESVIMAAGRGQFSVTHHGETMYIKVEAKVKNPEGSAKRYSPATLDEATHVFISEKGYGTPRIGTYYPPKGKYTTGRLFTDLPDDAPHLEALDEVVAFVNGEANSPGFQVEVESRCGLCGHKLEDPVSVQRGIGPECASKPTGTKILHASPFMGEPQPLTEDEKVSLRDQIADAGISHRQQDLMSEAKDNNPLAGVTASVPDAAFAALSREQQIEQVREEIGHISGDLHEAEAQAEALNKQIQTLRDEIIGRKSALRTIFGVDG